MSALAVGALVAGFVLTAAVGLTVGARLGRRRIEEEEREDAVAALAGQPVGIALVEQLPFECPACRRRFDPSAAYTYMGFSTRQCRRCRDSRAMHIHSRCTVCKYELLVRPKP